LKKTLLAAKSIAYSSGPSGVYVAGLVQRLGIADEIKSKMRQFRRRGSGRAGRARRGRARLSIR